MAIRVPNVFIPNMDFSFNVPVLPEPAKRAGNEPGVKKAKVKVPKVIFGVTLGQVFYSALIFGYVTNISVVIQSEQLGNATEAGLAISIFTLGTLLAGFVFGKIKHMLPISYLPVAVLFTGLGMMICYFSNSLSMIFVGSIIAGAGMGIGLPGVFARVTEATPPDSGTSYVGLVVVGQGLGGIMGPFAFSVIMNIFNQDIGRFPLLISTVGLLLLAVIWFIAVKLPKPNEEVQVSIE